MMPNQKFFKILYILLAVAFLTGGLFAGQTFAKTARELDASQYG